MKLVLVIIVFFSLLSCKDPGPKQKKADVTTGINQTNCIERIFEKDSLLGEIRNHASENISLSRSIKNYTKELESLDYSDCPQKFVASFHDHIKAWKRVTKISDKYPLLRGELHNVFTILEKSEDSTEFKSLAKQVWDTWYRVEEEAK